MKAKIGDIVSIKRCDGGIEKEHLNLVLSIRPSEQLNYEEYFVLKNKNTEYLYAKYNCINITNLNYIEYGIDKKYIGEIVYHIGENAIYKIYCKICLNNQI